MIQSMEVLQLPIQALEEHSDQAMEENPILEKEERDQSLPRLRSHRDVARKRYYVVSDRYSLADG